MIIRPHRLMNLASCVLAVATTLLEYLLSVEVATIAELYEVGFANHVALEETTVLDALSVLYVLGAIKVRDQTVVLESR